MSEIDCPYCYKFAGNYDCIPYSGKVYCKNCGGRIEVYSSGERWNEYYD